MCCIDNDFNDGHKVFKKKKHVVSIPTKSACVTDEQCVYIKETDKAPDINSLFSLVNIWYILEINC